MSDTVMVKGQIAILKRPFLEDADRDTFNEDQWDAKKDQFDLTEPCLSLNNEGTLIILSHTEDDYYGLVFAVPGIDPNFYVKLNELDLEIEEGTARGFFEIYYNGADSVHTTMTLERYRGHLKDYPNTTSG